MAQFDVLISFNDCKSLIESNKIITQNDRFRIDSYTHQTLLSYLGSGFSQPELEEIYLLESNNLKRILLLATGYYDDNVRNEVSQTPYLRELAKGIRDAYKLKSVLYQEAVFFTLYMKYFLSDFDFHLKVKFEGTIPKKLFSFRQQGAEMWFTDYTNYVLGVALGLYSREPQSAYSYILANTAYYLNKSQTSKYDKILNESMNSAVHRILVNLMGDNFVNKKPSNRNSQFFKDL